MAVTVITGDIGAGKSSAAKIMADILCYERLDADITARSLWERPDIKAQAVRRWGSDILDVQGNIIRAEIARRIFSAKSDYDFCNALLHPLVMLELEEHSREIGAAVIEIPLLPEVGRPVWADTVIYVAASFDVRAERCRSRGWDAEELRRRENFLLPQSRRIDISDYIIFNEGSISELERQTGEIINEYKRSSGEKEHTRQRQMES